MNKRQQILVIHGGTTYKDYYEYIKAIKEKTPKLEWLKSRRDWKNELQFQLGNKFVVYVPQMPNKTNAQYGEWKILFEKIVDLLEENFILIGYSLGGAFITKYLSENKISKRIRKTCLLGTPFDNSGMEAEPLYSFLRMGNIKNFRDQAGAVFFYHSKDDFAVPFDHFENYKKELPHANFRKYDTMNHFIVEEIPELIMDISGL